tara:strand:- start:38 stop:334 length:297 start_codon:yes stop_codon:yes gene_type:complete
MRFVQIINRKRFTLIGLFLFIYVMVNLFEGERGLISYYKNKQIKKQLIIKEKLLKAELISIENKNDLLTGLIDLDYLEILYRSKFMLGKKNEYIFTNN